MPIEVFLYGWVLSLLSTCIPLEFMHLMIDKFRREGWPFLYRLVIAYLLHLKEELMASNDSSEFLMKIDNGQSKELGIQWAELIDNCFKVKIWILLCTWWFFVYMSIFELSFKSVLLSHELQRMQKSVRDAEIAELPPIDFVVELQQAQLRVGGGYFVLVGPEVWPSNRNFRWYQSGEGPCWVHQNSSDFVLD